MQFSAKITNSVLAYVSRRQWPRERIFEMTELPYEFLRDPSSWLDAGEVERFVASMTRELAFTDPQLLGDVGAAAHELRAWGVLDSVLKMMSTPADIYSQPQRFLSYFISPAPPIANLRRESDGVSFDLPIAQSEFPFVATYLAAALASLPRYLGRDPATVDWRSNTIQIRWASRQIPLIAKESVELVPRPELVNRLVRDVEVTQARLETRELEVIRLERELKEMEAEVRRLKSRTSEEPVTHVERKALSEQLALVRDLGSKLMDCTTRAHQALGFAKALLQNEVQFQSVLRKVDWEGARAQYPWYHLQSTELIERMQSRLARGWADEPQASEESSGSDEVPLHEVIHQAVEQWKREHPGEIDVHESASFETTFPVNRDRMSLILNHLLAQASTDMNHSGKLEVVALQNGQRVEMRLIQHRRKGRPRHLEELPLFSSSDSTQLNPGAVMDELLSKMGAQLQIIDRTGEPRELVCTFDVL